VEEIGLDGRTSIEPMIAVGVSIVQTIKPWPGITLLVGSALHEMREWVDSRGRNVRISSEIPFTIE
jgi:hypothetical protein